MKRSLKVGLAVSGAVLLAGAACETMFVDSTPGVDSSDFVASGQTESFFTARQIDPRSEDSAGPAFVDAADFDGDGLMDLVSAWNQSQPIQVHLQRRDELGDPYFLTIPVAGGTPITKMSGLRAADMDSDGIPDIVALVKDTGTLAICDFEREDCDVTDNEGIIEGALWGGLALFYTPDDPLTEIFQPAVLENSFFAGTDGKLPEEEGYSGFDIGDFDGQLGPDIVVAFNSAEGDPKINRIDLYLNPGPARARNQDNWDNATIFQDLPTAKSVAGLDVDRDGDLDVVATYPNAKNTNVFWLPNPMIQNGMGANVDAVSDLLEWNIRSPLGNVADGADTLTLGDVDGDDLTDVVVRSSAGKIVQWFQAPAEPSTTYIRNPWRVFTLAEFLDREPQGMAIGDLNADGQVEAVIAAEGAVVWFDSTPAPTVYDHWTEHLIVDDEPEEEDAPAADATIGDLIDAISSGNADPTAQNADAEGTFINSLLVVDIDGDGLNDIVGTIDRGELSGLADDALVWFRNNRG